MKKSIFAIVFFAFSAGADFPAGPLPPAPDVMNGTAQERQAHANLVLDYLRDWANYYLLQDYTTFQNQDTSDRILTAAQVIELVKVLDDYKEVLATCPQEAPDDE